MTEPPTEPGDEPRAGLDPATGSNPAAGPDRRDSPDPAAGPDPFPPEASAVTQLLVVGDVDRARDFYVDVLGAELFREYGGTSAVLQLLGTWILLVTGGPPTEGKPTVTFAPPADPDRVDHQLTIRVPDCRGAYDTLTARGAGFLAPPVDRGGEVRAFFRDPDGHLIEISEVY